MRSYLGSPATNVVSRIYILRFIFNISQKVTYLKTGTRMATALRSVGFGLFFVN